MIQLIVFLVCLASCAIGAICGIGGGVIIKPALDSLEIFSVSALSFLSGLTVLSMSFVSLLRRRNERQLTLSVAVFLSLGAVTGGYIGNQLFQIIKSQTGNDNYVGMIQSVALAVITLLTLVYTAFLRGRIKSHRITNILVCVFIGALLGMISSFLGIGGGPINLAILYFFFSMPTKSASANSLFIIFFSQISNLLTSFMNGTLPQIDLSYLAFMVTGGVLGGIIGSYFCKKMKESQVDRLFDALLCVIIIICIRNAVIFVR